MQSPSKQVSKEKLYLGTVEVDMGRMFIFGSKQPLHEMLSFVPGMGNGTYEVYGEMSYVPGHGFHITKVEIECVSLDEIKYYDAQTIDPLEVLEH